MTKPNDETPHLKLHPRPKEPVAIDMPTDTLESLRHIAAQRDMSAEALMKLYIGQGLRQDLAKQFADRVLETTASVLARHIESEAEISSILREIRTESIGTK